MLVLKPVVDIHIWTVALDMRLKASRQASAGGHFSIRSLRTDVAANIVKSTSSIVCAIVSIYKRMEKQESSQVCS